MRLCFICGAPRSGTTLLADLLDGHPEVVVFPFESKVWFYYRKYLKMGYLDFFLRDYLNTPEMLALNNERWRKQFEAYRKKVYGVGDGKVGGFSVREYLRSLSVSSITLSSIYDALFCGCGHDLNEDKLFVIKCPVYNEYGAVDLCSIPDACFVHVRRDYKTRYISAKKRRVNRYGFAPRLNGKDFTTAHAEISMFSATLSKLNSVVVANYKRVNYESMLQERDMDTLAMFLGIEFNKELLEQRKSPASSFAAPDQDGRINDYIAGTTRAERDRVEFINGDLDVLSEWNFLLPSKNENPKDYWRDSVDRFDNLRGWSSSVQQKLFTAMVDKINNGEEVQD